MKLPTLRPTISRFRITHEILLLGCILVLGACLSLFLLGSKSIWFDEALSIQRVQLWHVGWGELFTYDRNMWFYYMLLFGWGHLGNGEAFLRGLSVLFALGSLPVYYLLSKHLFGQKVALLAVFLLAINSFFVRYAQEVRGYSLYFLLSLMSTWIFLKLLHKPSKILYFLYILCVALSIYTQIFAVFLLLIHTLLLLFTSRSSWKRYSICVLLILICISPLLLKGGQAKDNLAWIPPVQITTLPAYFLALSSEQPFLCILYALLCSISLIWIVSMTRKERHLFLLSKDGWKDAFIYTWLFLPLLLTLCYSVLFSPVFVDRYLITGLAPLLLLVSIGLSKIIHRRLFLICLISICIFSFLSLTDWYTGNQYFTLGASNKKEDWRTAVAYICTDARANDSVTFYAYFVHIPYDYYAHTSSECLRKHVHEIELASAPYWDGGGGSLPAPNRALLKNLPTMTTRVWLVLSHGKDIPQQVIQRDLIQRLLAQNYVLVSMKQFEGVAVQLYILQPSSISSQHAPKGYALASLCSQKRGRVKVMFLRRQRETL